MLLPTLLLQLLGSAQAANWAQVSGERHTNAGVLEVTPWTKRHGHAVAALDFSEDYERDTGQRARLFVLGGDSSVQGSQDLRAYPGGGAMRNDVWSTTGASWTVQQSILKTTKWGDPLPQLVANLTWLQTNNGKRPPRGVTYGDWTACAAAAWAVAPPSGCDDPTQPPGAYLADNMFSPRRNFVALAFQSQLWVFGGRAREHFPMPESQLRGGTGPGTFAPRNVRWREFAVLKNDVWRSSDAGASWKLVTPGCAFPQRSLVHKGSRPELQCDDDDQCEGDASCVVDEATATGFCVCNMWSPREFHAVVEHDDALFLSGGYALVELGNCGVEENARLRPSGEEFACSGGYRAYLNDVWSSTDGEHWTQLMLHASFSPRGEHAMLVFKSLLYVLGGRTGSSTDKEATTLLQDVWASGDGAMWTLVDETAPWAPRAKHVALTLPGAPDQTSGDDPDDQLVLFFGEDEERTLEDVWVWKGPGSDWLLDYSSGTSAAEYVTPQSGVAYLRGMLHSDALALRAAGVATIEDLTTLSFEQTLELRRFMPVCDYIALAKLVVKRCTVQATVYEGAEYADARVVQGANGDDEEAALLAAQTQGEDDWDGCTHVGAQVLDPETGRLYWPDVRGVDQVQVLRDVFGDAQESVCQWRPKPRSGHAGAVFKRQVLVLGGLTAPDYFENDVWYRDARRPKAQIRIMPNTESSQTQFLFESDKEACIFEYHVLDMVEMLVVRNWTRSLGELDVKSWLDGGTFRLRVRALDAAGNVDEAFESGRNEYTWVYVPPLPWGLIIGLTSVVTVLLAGFFMEWRKRRKRAAMERYAMKRMRRKMKKKSGAPGGKKPRGKGEGDANWRETYDDAKDGKKGKGKKTRKAVDAKKKAGTKDKAGKVKPSTKKKAGDASEKKTGKKKAGEATKKSSPTKKKLGDAAKSKKSASNDKSKKKEAAKSTEKRPAKAEKKDKAGKDVKKRGPQKKKAKKKTK